jgi:hypothetical protein
VRIDFAGVTEGRAGLAEGRGTARERRRQTPDAAARGKKVLRGGAVEVILCEAYLGALPLNLTHPPQSYSPSSLAFTNGETL